MFGTENQESFATNFVARPDERKIHRHTIILAVVFTIIVAGVAAMGASASYSAVKHGTGIFAEMGNLPIIKDVGQMFGVASQAATNNPAKDERLSILFLGVGGDGHDGSQLTDTILLASIDLKGKRVGLFSIPRDMAFPLGNGRFEKINAVNAYAEQDHPGEGAKRTADEMSKLLEVPIDHVIKIDFRGFTKLVDAIGGVDVNVEHSFTDPQFPTSDDKWTTVSFKKGMQHMSGETALTFTRSRHGNNFEGSDFARSRRQQIVMLAIREKLLSLNTLTDGNKLAAVWNAVSSNVQTDLSIWDMGKLAAFAKDFNRENIITHVLTDAPEGELTAANVNGAFMLFPRKPDWSEIRAIAKDPFLTNEARVAKDHPIENIKLELKNGTARTGFASQVAAKLEKSGYEITAFGNAIRRGYERSTIFDLTKGKKPVELGKLRRLLDADVSLYTPTSTDPQNARVVLGDGLAPERISSPNTDFLIILGEASSAFVDSYAGASNP